MRILIAEDDVATAKALKLLLEKSKYSVDIVHNGTDAWDYISEGPYDVIVLDIMMPGMSGLEVLSLIRNDHISTPVLLLTAKAEVARIKALGRRSETYTEDVRSLGNLVLDSNRYEMRVQERSVTLTNKEFQLMELFMRHPGHVFSTEHLMNKIWGYDSESDIDVVWTHIGFVRKKLRKIGANVEIKTMRGSGYALEVVSC